MLTLRKPSTEFLRRQSLIQSGLEFTYTAVGATADHPPAGYVVDHLRTCLGAGEATFLVATQALARWEQFNLGWLEATPADTPLETGAVIAVIARTFGLWSLNFARIVYVVDELQPIRRFGFAYGTLPDHVESGEERFLIEWDQKSDSVYYDVLAFSRPRHPLAKLGYPLVRRAQRRFGRDSAAAMLRCVARNNGLPMATTEDTPTID